MIKVVIKYVIICFLFSYVEINAQDLAGSNSAIPSKTTMKGRRELRKDKRIKKNEASVLKMNEAKEEAHSDKPFHEKKRRKFFKDKKRSDKEIRKKG